MAGHGIFLLQALIALRIALGRIRIAERDADEGAQSAGLLRGVGGTGHGHPAIGQYAHLPGQMQPARGAPDGFVRQRDVADLAIADHDPPRGIRGDFVVVRHEHDGVPGGDGKSAYLKLKERGILVRFFDKPGLRDKLRITIGTPQEKEPLFANTNRNDIRSLSTELRLASPQDRRLRGLAELRGLQYGVSRVLALSKLKTKFEPLEAKRKLAEGAVKLEGETITDPAHLVLPQEGETLRLSLGKKRHALVKR